MINPPETDEPRQYHADAMVAVAETLRELLLQRGFKNQAFLYQTNAADTNRYVQIVFTPEELEAEVLLPDGAFRDLVNDYAQRLLERALITGAAAQQG